MPTTIEEINSLFDKAMNDENPIRSVDRQLECWAKLKTLIPSFPIDINDPNHTVVEGFADSLYDWLPALEVDLGALAESNSQYVGRYLAYVKDLLANVRADDHRHNFERSYAEALALAGRLEEAEAVLQRLLQEAPQEEWTWLTWGDLYLGQKPPNRERARAIYLQGQAQPGLETEGLLEARLAELDNSPNPSQAVSTKVGRNDPCPCGSGKKAKKCCQGG